MKLLYENNKNEILKPQIYETRHNLFLINTNKQLYEFIINKKIFQKFSKAECRRARNCFFKCMRQIFNNNEAYHLYYREKFVFELIIKKILIK